MSYTTFEFHGKTLLLIIIIMVKLLRMANIHYCGINCWILYKWKKKLWSVGQVTNTVTKLFCECMFNHAKLNSLTTRLVWL